MSTVDLHVHSIYSGNADDKTLRRLNANECYSSPEFVVRTALEKGRSLVTLTDHDVIEGVMSIYRKYPHLVIPSVESTVSFPEDDVKVHVLVYGLTPEEFQTIQVVRNDIYQFRDYLKERKLAYSVAHALLRMDPNFSVSHVEKLLLLFDVFEGINGSQSRKMNQTWTAYLESLSPDMIDILYRRHHIEPISNDPWIKGFTGGTDDHSGLFIGETYTQGPGETPAEFLNSLRHKQTRAGGSYGNFREMGLTLLKVGVDISSNHPRTANMNKGVQQIVGSMLSGKPLSFTNRLKLKLARFWNQISPDPLRGPLVGWLDDFLSRSFSSSSERANALFNDLAEISDLYIQKLIHRIGDGTGGGFSGIIPQLQYGALGLLFAILFYISSKVVHLDRDLINYFSSKIIKNQQAKKVLWFSDEPYRGNMPCLTAECTIVSFDDCNMPGAVGLPIIGRFTQAEGNKVWRIPSLMGSLRLLEEYDPDMIVVSTSGPVGLLGLLYAKLTGIYSLGVLPPENDMDRTNQVNRQNRMDTYHRLFYAQVDEVDLSYSVQSEVLPPNLFLRDRLNGINALK